MNKFFSPALYCGLLLSGGKALAVGTDLLKRLDDEKIIGQEKTNPFIAPETATTPQKAAVDLPQSQASKPADPVPRASAVKSDKAAGIDPAKITRLNDALRQANSTITALNKQLSVLEREKASLEQAVAHEKDRVAEKDRRSPGLNRNRMAVRKNLLSKASLRHYQSLLTSRNKKTRNWRNNCVKPTRSMPR